MSRDINIYNEQGKQIETLSLDLTGLTEKPLNPRAFAMGIRVLFQNWRQGTVASKGRSDLSFSNKKPWKQKGTGRARAGTIRSPLWRKGGAIFGPQPRTRVLSINDKQKRLVLNNIFFNVVENGSIVGLEFNSLENKPSTKVAHASLKALGLENKKVLLFLSFHDDLAFSSFVNLANVKVVFYDQPNAYDLTDADCWIFLKKDFDLFKEMILQWN